jgi:phospholipase/carboxylesterase
MSRLALVVLCLTAGCGSAAETIEADDEASIEVVERTEAAEPGMEPLPSADSSGDDDGEVLEVGPPIPAPIIGPPPESRARWSTPHGELDVVVVGDGSLGVVLLHGYGALPEDMLPIARGFAASTPTAFVVPTSPRIWRPGGDGRAWFERAALDANAQIERARDEVEALIEHLRADGHEHVVIAGFSQGASLSIEVALHAGETGISLAGLVALSARSLPRYRHRWAALSGLPMLLSHGRVDPVIPFFSGARIAAEAEAAGAALTFVPFDGAHEIPLTLRAEIRTFLSALAH